MTKFSPNLGWFYFPTFEVNVEPTEFQLDTLQSFPERFMVVADGFLRSGAEGQTEVLVRFLSVVVRTHRVHPQHHLLPILVLSKIKMVKTGDLEM